MVINYFRDAKRLTLVMSGVPQRSTSAGSVSMEAGEEEEEEEVQAGIWVRAQVLLQKAQS